MSREFIGERHFDVHVGTLNYRIMWKMIITNKKQSATLQFKKLAT